MTMPTLVPRQEWEQAFNKLSRLYDGAMVSIEVMNREIGDQREVDKQPFRGISIDSTGVSVHVGSARASHLGHRISSPMNVWIDSGRDGKIEAIEITASDGTMTLLHFRSPLTPEGLEAAVE